MGLTLTIKRLTGRAWTDKKNQTGTYSHRSSDYPGENAGSSPNAAEYPDRAEFSIRLSSNHG